MAPTSDSDRKFVAKIIPFECEDEDWDTLLQYFTLRERIFVSERHWELDDFNGYELDAYDKETSIYVVAQETQSGDVVGGARLSPTMDEKFRPVHEHDPSGFMISDAAKGLLPGLPQGLCFDEPPSGPDIWELTRVVVSERGVTDQLFAVGKEYLMHIRVSKCLALGSPGIMRIARKFGLRPKPIGPIVSNDTGKFLAFSCNIPVYDHSSHSLMAITKKSDGLHAP
jgi:acyl homoserine lactone synthase